MWEKASESGGFSVRKGFLETRWVVEFSILLRIIFFTF